MSTTIYSPSELSYTSTPLASTSTLPSAFQISENPFRSDGRSPFQFRDIGIQTNIIEGTLGSSKVIIEDLISGIGCGSEIVVGVRGEVESCKENESGKIVISVECAPTASLNVSPSQLLSLSELLNTIFSLPCTYLNSLIVLPSQKAWTLYLDLLILSSNASNIIDLAIIAIRSALASVMLPATRTIEGDTVLGGDREERGIGGLVKGGVAGKDSVGDWELDLDGDDVRVIGWEGLPIGISLNLINQLPHLDASILEEQTSTSKIVCCYSATGELIGLRNFGEGEIEIGRIITLLLEGRRCAGELMQVLNSKLN